MTYRMFKEKIRNFGKVVPRRRRTTGGLTIGALSDVDVERSSNPAMIYLLLRQKPSPIQVVLVVFFQYGYVQGARCVVLSKP